MSLSATPPPLTKPTRPAPYPSSLRTLAHPHPYPSNNASQTTLVSPQGPPPPVPPKSPNTQRKATQRRSWVNRTSHQSIPDPESGKSKPVNGEKKSPDDPEETGQLHKDSYAFLGLSTVMALSPGLLIILAVSAATLDNKPRSEWGDKVMDIILLVPTIYPVLFAALTSKAVKSFAVHLAQRGTTLGLLEQLFASQTVGGTVVSIFFLRMINMTLFLLLALWFLSPLGGQAALRMLTLEDAVAVRTPTEIWYRSSDTATQLVDSASLARGVIGRVNAIYMSSLFVNDESRRKPLDIYGNLKVPMYEALDPKKADKSGFIPIDPENPTYSSLIGVPFQGALEEGNATFSIHSSYSSLSCTKPANKSADQLPPAMKKAMLNVDNPFDTWRSMFLNMTEESWASQRTHNRTIAYNLNAPRTLDFVSWIGKVRVNNVATNYYAYSLCSQTETYLESRVSCQGRSCGITSVRPSLIPHEPPHLSLLDGKSPFLNGFFYTLFSQSTNSEMSSGQTTVTEWYINDPFTPWTTQNSMVSLLNLTAEAFSTRFTTAFNSYYSVYISPDSILGIPLSLSNLTDPTPADVPKFWGNRTHPPAPGTTHFGQTADPWNPFAPFLARRTPATWEVTKQRYRVNWVWMTSFLVSGIALMGVAMGGLWVQLGRVAPEFLGTVAGCLRDAKWGGGMGDGGGSWLDGWEASRRGRSRRVWICDVEGGGEKGKVALVCEGEEEWERRGEKGWRGVECEREYR